MSGRASAALSVSVVTYAPDPEVLGRALGSVKVSVSRAQQAGAVEQASVTVVDNGPGVGWNSRLAALTQGCFGGSSIAADVLSGHGNVGYGRGHNLAIARSSANFHLIMNPDVILDADAIVEAVRFMQAHPDVGMLAPYTTNESGEREYLCKRYPTVLVLAVRGFMPQSIEAAFDRQLAVYEMRDLPVDRPYVGVPLASGSFMLARREPLTRVGGFSERFFLYFEDFDLSLRMGKVASIAFVPTVKVVHLGGYAARKGVKHIGLFAMGGIKFFNRHGWRWW